MIEEQINQLTVLNEWFAEALGQSVAEEFSKQLEPVSDHLIGDNLLQLGSCASNLWLTKLRFKNKWIASPFTTEITNTVLCSLNQIPIQRNSMDCVIVPLVLEPFDTSFNLIDEIDRILKPMGYVIFLCINPWSVWGGALKCGLLHCYSKGRHKMRTPLHLNRIFIQRGYRQCALTNFYYSPPVNNKSMLKKMVILNEVGKMLWPFPSGFYCYIAQKFESIAPTINFNALIQPLNKEYDSLLQAFN